MSPKNTILTVGLTAMGLFGYAATRAAYSGDPVPPSGLAAAPASPATPSVLLLTNGRLLQGPIVRDQDFFVISQNGGEIRFNKSQVEDVFGSLVDVYKYKLAQIPDNDPDEHMKLARWCLAQNLAAEARAELKVVLEISPRSTDAKLMLASINASEIRAAARPRVDRGLVQTRAEVPASADRQDNRPAEIDPTVLRRASKEFGGVGLPVIFDLPPTVAVKRAQQFTNMVHAVLLDNCAKCHNEKHDGDFQLVQVKRRRDLTADVIRANLDSTLKLIDPENPSRSELLSSALLPHGNGANRKPIFRGSNDPRFQIISAWVNSLRSTKSASEGVVQTRLGVVREPKTGGAEFAADRTGSREASQNGDGMPKPFAEFPKPQPRLIPPVRYVEGQGMVPEAGPPSPEEFPATNLLNGQVPLLKPGSKVPGALGKTSPKASSPTSVVESGDSLPVLPLVPGQASVPAAPGQLAMPLPPVDPAKVGKPRKPVKLDPSILEKMILNRNGGR